MRSHVQKVIVPFFIFPLGLLTLLSGCQLMGFSSQPPLPTIVSVTDTPPLQPLATRTAEAASQQSTGGEIVEQQADSTVVSAPTATNTKESTPVSTLAVPSTEVPATTPLTPTSPPPPATPAAQLPPLEAVGLKLIPVASDFHKPVFLTHAGDGTGRLFVVEQAGRILILEDGVINSTPFLDIVSVVGSDANEQGLLSVAFHPDYANNGLFFVNYTNKQGDTVIARYGQTDSPDIANPDSAKILMTIGQPFSNHNGGQIAFGPDGYLYIGMGDGGAANDPQNRAQNLGDLLGKILRIDVDRADPYGVPENNPFVGNAQARPEIWSYGWRNPWRFSFDLSTDDMYIADVGQNQYEEIHVEWAGTPGQNYGWRLMEGFHCFTPSECDPASLGVILPVAEYDHKFGCSVSGGYVYRGSQFPTMDGIYFYGDYCSGIIWGIRRESDGSWSEAQLLQSGQAISSFGQDRSGEVYLVDHKGDIFQLGN